MKRHSLPLPPSLYHKQTKPFDKVGFTASRKRKTTGNRFSWTKPEFESIILGRHDRISKDGRRLRNSRRPMQI
ncbi:hypothetical protein BDW75DRAFT_205463 [Aspergillus navahoensis]